MDYKLPFYGLKTIKEITEDEKNYLVSYYELDGTEGIITKVIKNEKNFNAILENYHKDLANYLKENKKKYEDYNDYLSKHLINSNIEYILKLATIITLTVSIILSINCLLLPSIILDILTAPLLIGSVGLMLQKRDYQKKSTFTENYQNLENKLFCYERFKNNNKISKTKFSHISREEKTVAKDLNNKILTRKVA